MLEKAAGNSRSAQVPAIHVKDPDEAPGCWLQFGTVLATGTCQE